MGIDWSISRTVQGLKREVSLIWSYAHPDAAAQGSLGVTGALLRPRGRGHCAAWKAPAVAAEVLASGGNSKLAGMTGIFQEPVRGESSSEFAFDGRNQTGNLFAHQNGI